MQVRSKDAVSVLAACTLVLDLYDHDRDLIYPPFCCKKNVDFLKNRVLRPPGAWEAPGSAQNNLIGLYFWSEVDCRKVILLRYFGVFIRVAAVFFSGEN